VRDAQASWSRKSAASGRAASRGATFARFAPRPCPARGAPAHVKEFFPAAFGAGAGIDLQQHPSARNCESRNGLPSSAAVRRRRWRGFDQLTVIQPRLRLPYEVGEPGATVGAAQSARMTNAMRLPRRRSSVAPGIGSLEAESDIEMRQAPQRIPLQRVAAMPIHAVSDAPIRARGRPERRSSARSRTAEARARAASPPAPAPGSGAKDPKPLRGELDEAPARRTAMPSIVCTFSGVGTEQPGALPAAIQPRLTRTWSSRFELQRGQHVIAGSTVQTLLSRRSAARRRNGRAR